mgnify:CR=1 FL=1
MNGLPAFVALLPGLLAGSLVLSIFTHWVTLLLSGWRRNPIDAPLPLTGRVWARVFTVIHPVPWLVLVGIPYGIYRFLTSPPAPGWRWFISGFVGAVVGTLLMAIIVLRRNRSRATAAAGARTIVAPAALGSRRRLAAQRGRLERRS